MVLFKNGKILDRLIKKTTKQYKKFKKKEEKLKYNKNIYRNIAIYLML